MKLINKCVIVFLFSFSIYAQEETKKPFYWGGNFIAEYAPKLYSDWNTTTVGGQVFLAYKINHDLFTTFNGCVHFIPTTTNIIDYSALRSFTFNLSYNNCFIKNLNHLYLFGLGYNNGKISESINKYYSAFALIDSYYKLNEKIELFLNFGSIYDFSNQNITPSLKIGFKASFIIISFDLTQYINWDNPASRLNNILSVPHITYHSP